MQATCHRSHCRALSADGTQRVELNVMSASESIYFRGDSMQRNVAFVKVEVLISRLLGHNQECSQIGGSTEFVTLRQCDFNEKRKGFYSFSTYRKEFILLSKGNVRRAHLMRLRRHALAQFICFRVFRVTKRVCTAVFTLSFHLSSANAPQRKAKFQIFAR